MEGNGDRGVGKKERPEGVRSAVPQRKVKDHVGELRRGKHTHARAHTHSSGNFISFLNSVFETGTCCGVS